MQAVQLQDVCVSISKVIGGQSLQAPPTSTSLHSPTAPSPPSPSHTSLTCGRPTLRLSPHRAQGSKVASCCHGYHTPLSCTTMGQDSWTYLSAYRLVSSLAVGGMGTESLLCLMQVPVPDGVAPPELLLWAPHNCSLSVSLSPSPLSLAGKLLVLYAPLLLPWVTAVALSSPAEGGLLGELAMLAVLWGTTS